MLHGEELSNGAMVVAKEFVEIGVLCVILYEPKDILWYVSIWTSGHVRTSAEQSLE